MVLYRGFTQIIEVRTRTNLSSNRWPRARDYILFYEDILRQLIYLRCVGFITLLSGGLYIKSTGQITTPGVTLHGLRKKCVGP